MIFPIGDTPNPPGTPLATYGLIGANVAVYLLVTLPFSAMTPDLHDPLLLEYLHSLGAYGSVSAAEIRQYVSAYDLIVYRFGFRPAEFSLISLFTSLFLHGGFLHLAGNMLFLWIFGDNIEYRLGRPLYIVGYLLFGVAATLFFAVFSLDSEIPLIGASGAISGVLGCYYLWFPQNRVRCFLFLFPFLMTTIMIPARIVLAFYLLIDNLLPFLVNGSGSGGVAHGAHIGGFFAGLGLAAVVEYGPRIWPEEMVHQDNDAELCSPEQIGDAVARGDLSAAAACVLSLKDRQQRKSIASSDILAIAEHLLNNHDDRNALGLFRQFIAENPNAPQLDRAYLGAGYALLRQPRQSTSAYHYFLSAVDLAETEKLLAEYKLNYVVIDSASFNPKFPPKSVIEQNPLPGDFVKENRKIYLTLNPSDYRKVTIPNVLDQTKRQVVIQLKSLGFRIGKERYIKDLGRDVVRGLEINKKKIKPGDRLPKNTVIDLVLGDGLINKDTVY